MSDKDIWVAVEFTKNLPFQRFKIYPGDKWLFCEKTRENFTKDGSFEIAGNVARKDDYKILYRGTDKKEAMRQSEWLHELLEKD